MRMKRKREGKENREKKKKKLVKWREMNTTEEKI